MVDDDDGRWMMSMMDDAVWEVFCKCFGSKFGCFGDALDMYWGCIGCVLGVLFGVGVFWLCVV